MRIAYVCSDLGVPLLGSKGASIHVRELCRALVDAGHDVLVAPARVGGSAQLGFDADVVPVPLDADDAAADALLASDLGGAAARDVRALLYAASARRRLASALAEFRADVVYERYSLLSNAGAWSARELGVPHLLEVNAPLTAEQARHRGLALHRAAVALERDVLVGADRLVAVSQEVGRWLVELGADPRRVHVLPNAVDPVRFRTHVAQRTATRARLGLDDGPVVGFLGTLKPWHDVATLVRAVGRLVVAGMRVRLLVIGDGPERRRLESLARETGAAETAVFLGSVQHDDVPALLAALDVAVVPYADEPDFYFSPLKLFECLAAGVPVVAADVGDLGHCVRDGWTGVLYRPGDACALADALLTLLLDPRRARTLADAGRDHVRRHHTWARNADEVARLAAEAIRAREEALAWV